MSEAPSKHPSSSPSPYSSPSSSPPRSEEIHHKHRSSSNNSLKVSPSGTLPALGSASSSSDRRHRSVKSITREYEDQQPAPKFPSQRLSPSPSTSTTNLFAPTPSAESGDGKERTSSLKSSQSNPAVREGSNHHSRTASVLLASASYPSTLSIAEGAQKERPRTLSSSSIAAGDQDRRPSLKLASAAYPSSYQIYSGNRSATTPASTSTPLPFPPPVMSTSSDMKSGPVTVAKQAAKAAQVSLPTLNVSLSDGELERKLPEEGFQQGDAMKQELELESVHNEDEDDDQVGELSSSSAAKVLPSQMTAAERRDHSRKHSRVHSRNLSVFFPRPGSEAEAEADHFRAAENYTRTPGKIQTHDLPGPTQVLAVPGESSGTSLSPSKSRKGHHRKHSVTHALYNSSNSANTAIPSSTSTMSPSMSESPWLSSPERERLNAGFRTQDLTRGLQDDLARAPTTARILSTPLWQITTAASLPTSQRPLLVFGALQFVIGAMLWMSGQSGDSLSLTGLGYLVVFDAFGILNGVSSEWLSVDWRRRANRSDAKQIVRRPFGPHRIESVLQFSQTIYLLFASIYVCKESVEHALLEGANEHHEEDDVGLHLPRTMLAIATAACLFSNMILQNHTKLVAACGITTTASDTTSRQRRGKGHGRANSFLVDPNTIAGPFLHLLSNPFSLTILFFCLTLTLAALVMPPFQAAALDKVLAGLESVAMLYVAYPASKALGKILLQTAPKSFNTQNVQLLRSIRTIEEHALVTYVAPPHLWQLTSPTSAAHQSDGALLGTSRVAKNASLIATVEIFLKDDASDVDVLEVTRWAWTLLAPSVGAGAGLQAGESLRGAIRAGEVSVQVSRERQRKEQRLAAAQQDHSHLHDHHHGHSCEHTHDHHQHQHQRSSGDQHHHTPKSRSYSSPHPHTH